MDKSKIPVGQRPALSLLLDDHRAVKKLFKQFEEAKQDSAKQSIAAETCHALSIHAQIEEEIFYPALRGVSDKIDDMLDEAKVEHMVAKQLIAKIESGDKAMLDANYKVLTEYVGHHVEEEESELFKAVIQAKVDLKAVAAQLEERKHELEGVTA
ncbi:Hemerythrin HHE cation binding domain-containing protein [Cupriavidus sp. OV038]|jgi:hemerythrin superfamily protein|uniref:hemerythrin domain-containing protein n=1 Tax=unclassified Cupriavidus TaxID=2640874 RepID=UPI0008DF9D82|nr:MULTISPECIES: hemerythrin domain-containing protein [unclassified Cupriavidus]SFC91427.1 Hemerythrin HHE cation binding domain-containing protein [Cupriavidus sp. OV038]SFP55690.1 Hemerythrin HHE cation binding domain-containing protein [Cupriavidus sp. OV096]